MSSLANFRRIEYGEDLAIVLAPGTPVAIRRWNVSDNCESVLTGVVHHVHGDGRMDRNVWITLSSGQLLDFFHSECMVVI